MDEPMQDQAPTSRPVRFCGWCRAYRTGTLLIDLQASGSGPSAPTLYACGSCREQYRLVPLADRAEA
jgi:hypothetical protein